jgi:hypothetical protein
VFLISSLVLFAVLRFEAQSVPILRLDDVIKSAAGESGKGTKPAAKAGAKDSEPDFVDIDNDLCVGVSGLPESVDGALRNRIDRFNKLPREQKVEQIIAGTTRYGLYARCVLLPACAALLKLAYLGRRRLPRSSPASTASSWCSPRTIMLFFLPRELCS